MATLADNWYLTVKTRTESGEDQDCGEDDVKVEVNGPSEASPKVKDLGNGEYFVSIYGLKASGTYEVHVKLNGQPITGSPFKIVK